MADNQLQQYVFLNIVNSRRVRAVLRHFKEGVDRAAHNLLTDFYRILKVP